VEAYLINRKGFERAIANLKVDPKVEAPAKKLLALLKAFFAKGTLHSKSFSKERTLAAEKN
jgi:hypothetical protein